MPNQVLSALRTLFFVTPLVAISLSTACSRQVPDEAESNTTAQTVDFVTDVKPILQENCLPCHNTGLLLGYLNLETKALAFKPGPNGAFIIPGNPGASTLYQLVLLKDGEKRAMPPLKHRLFDSEKETLRLWIEQGAPWPDGPEGKIPPLAGEVQP
jgi:hypothetical protein